MGWGQITKDSEDKVREWVTLLEVQASKLIGSWQDGLEGEGNWRQGDSVDGGS